MINDGTLFKLVASFDQLTPRVDGEILLVPTTTSERTHRTPKCCADLRNEPNGPRLRATQRGAARHTCRSGHRCQPAETEDRQEALDRRLTTPQRSSRALEGAESGDSSSSIARTAQM